MRAALVSPYSWTYPGGVTRHIEALAAELLGDGPRSARVRAVRPRYARDRLRAPWRAPAGARGARLAGPARRHDRLAVQRRGLQPLVGPHAVSTMRRELRAFAPDVVHLHEPVAPVVGWDALSSADAPLVGTFHCYSESRLPHAIAGMIGARRKLNRLNLRLAVSEAAAWTGRRFYGGHYRVIPNGVRSRGGHAAPPRRRAPGDPLRIVFVGQTVERKGLPVLLRAFEALRAQVPAELTIVGATQDEIAPLLVDGAGVTALGRVDDAARHAALLERRPAVRAVARRRVVRDGADRGVRRRPPRRRVRHRRLPRRRHRRRRRAARAARRRYAAGRDAARPRARPRLDRPARRRRAG